MTVSDTCLIALTEAPTQNIKVWNQRKYEQNGINVSVLRMISTGYHDPEVWKSIIFQLHNAFYILYKKGICIWNFSLANNVFIKDTNYDNNNIGFWKYIVDGINFYIPNYGSILVIDSQFKDLDITDEDRKRVVTQFSTSGEKNDKNFRYKIMMKTIFDKDQSDVIDKRNKENFTDMVFNSAKFHEKTDVNVGGVGIDDTIDVLINGIRGLEVDNINNFFINHAHFLHNRVGTLLNDSEKKNIINDKKEFVKGQLIAYLDGENYYVAIYKGDAKSKEPIAAPVPVPVPAPAPAPAPALSPSPSPSPLVPPALPISVAPAPNQVEIIHIPNNRSDVPMRAEVKTVELASVFFINETIKQSYKPNCKLSEDELIETYKIDF